MIYYIYNIKKEDDLMLVTYTGKTFDFNNINKDMICKEDIFQAMTRINRFIGHSTRAYSDAEHLSYCALMARKLHYSPRLQMLTFIHDFAEAYVGDMPTPLKSIMPQYKEIEKKLEKAIHEHFVIDLTTAEEHELIKRVDNTMLVIEMRDLTLHNHEEYISERTYLDILNDKDFNLKVKPIEYELKLTLELIFDELLKGLKNDA